MRLIGDIHGNFKQYEELMEGADESIQLGDYGLGFPDHSPFMIESSLSTPLKTTYHKAPEGHRFIRGNHDCPYVCASHPRYMGDFGMFRGEVFYLSGAWSIDKEWRTPGRNWWSLEELEYAVLDDAIKLFTKKMPRVVVSHDAPHRINEILHKGRAFLSKTTSAMDAMLDEWMPDYWYFAHHHMSWEGCLPNWNTQFKCLDTYEVHESAIIGA